MKKTTILCAMFLCTAISLFAQVQDSIKKFNPTGKVEGRIFSDFYYEYNQKKTAFEVTRAYLGYNYNYTENVSARVLFDVAKSDIAVKGKTVDTITNSLQYTAHLKLAYGMYKYQKLTVSFGMIELNQLKVQDQLWGRRYLMKTIQDEYGYCPSADLGAKVEYKFADWLSSDLCMRNGEGFKKQQADNIYWYGIGFTLLPLKGFTYRTYFDLSKKVITQINFSNCISYITKKFKAGAEIVVSQDNGYYDGRKLISYSISAGYKLNSKVEFFGRFDQLTSNKLTGAANKWNYDNNLNFVIGGIQFNPMENIAISINGRYLTYENTTKDEKLSAYMNLDFKF